MLGIIVAAHGQLAPGLVSAAKLIMGEVENVEALELCHGDDINQFGENIKDAMHKVDNGKGVLVFTDIFGASPYNQSALQTRELADLPCRIVTGVNLPMLLEGIGAQMTDQNVNDAWESIVKSGQESIKEFYNEFEQQ